MNKSRRGARNRGSLIFASHPRKHNSKKKALLFFSPPPSRIIILAPDRHVNIPFGRVWNWHTNCFVRVISKAIVNEAKLSILSRYDSPWNRTKKWRREREERGKKIRFRYNSVEERNIQSLYTSSQRLQLRSGIKGGTSPDRKFVQPVSAFKLRETIVFSYDQRTRSGLPLLAPFVPFSSVSGNVSSPSRSRLPSWRNRSDNSMNVDLGEIPVEITSCWVEKKLKRKRIYIYNWKDFSFKFSFFRIRSFGMCY